MDRWGGGLPACILQSMEPSYRPFSMSRRAQLSPFLEKGAASLDDLARVRAAITGREANIDALGSLIESEPDLKGRLEERILPSIFRYARDLLAKDDPALELHHAGRAARTVIPRAEVAGWVAHMILGTLPAPGRDHPDVDFELLLAHM